MFFISLRKIRMPSSVAVVAASLLGVAHGLAVPTPTAAVVQQPACAASAGLRPAPLGRRAVALGALLLPLSASANTQPMLDKPTEQFDAAAEKRKAFMEKQKVFKKEWRKQLANLEFSSNDEEALDAITKLTKLVYMNGKEIPEGVRKQDMDQVRHRCCFRCRRLCSRWNRGRLKKNRSVAERGPNACFLHRCIRWCRASWRSRRAWSSRSSTRWCRRW